MEWSSAYSTGIARIDEQHKMLFKMSADFRAALDEGGGEQVYGGLLKSLRLYARSHFGFEEQCMARYECPVAQTNCQAHVRFLEVLAQFQERYAANRFVRADAQRLVEFIDRWLSDHIGQIDLQIKPYVTLEPI